jgi:hypothetical protein
MAYVSSHHKNTRRDYFISAVSQRTCPADNDIRRTQLRHHRRNNRSACCLLRLYKTKARKKLSDFLECNLSRFTFQHRHQRRSLDPIRFSDVRIRPAEHRRAVLPIHFAPGIYRAGCITFSFSLHKAAIKEKIIMFEYTEMSISHYDDAYKIWQESEGLYLTIGDTNDAVQKYLDRNPGMSFVCIDKEKNCMAGTILCGHDGRRGFIYHLAVRKGYRGRSIG